MRAAAAPRKAHGERRGALQLVGQALEGQDGFVLDRREIVRDGPSYSVDTLESLKQDFPASTLCLIVGMDAFLGLPRWNRWQRIFELAHVVVAHRPAGACPIEGHW